MFFFVVSCSTKSMIAGGINTHYQVALNNEKDWRGNSIKEGFLTDIHTFHPDRIIAPGEVFQISLNRMFLRYLEAIDAEIIVYVETTDPSKPILNPNEVDKRLIFYKEGQPHRSFVPIIDAPIYGPACAPEHPLMVRLIVVELDKKDRENLTQLISNAQRIGKIVADPAKGLVIDIAASIAQLLVSTNTDDYEFDMSYYFYPVIDLDGSSGTREWNLRVDKDGGETGKAIVLPLQEQQIVSIKDEHPDRCVPPENIWYRISKNFLYRFWLLGANNPDEDSLAWERTNIKSKRIYKNLIKWQMSLEELDKSLNETKESLSCCVTMLKKEKSNFKNDDQKMVIGTIELNNNQSLEQINEAMNYITNTKESLKKIEDIEKLNGKLSTIEKSFFNSKTALSKAKEYVETIVCDLENNKEIFKSERPPYDRINKLFKMACGSISNIPGQFTTSEKKLINIIKEVDKRRNDYLESSDLSYKNNIKFVNNQLVYKNLGRKGYQLKINRYQDEMYDNPTWPEEENYPTKILMWLPRFLIIQNYKKHNLIRLDGDQFREKTYSIISMSKGVKEIDEYEKLLEKDKTIIQDLLISSTERKDSIDKSIQDIIGSVNDLKNLHTEIDQLEEGCDFKNETAKQYANKSDEEQGKKLFQELLQDLVGKVAKDKEKEDKEYWQSFAQKLVLKFTAKSVPYEAIKIASTDKDLIEWDNVSKRFKIVYKPN